VREGYLTNGIDKFGFRLLNFPDYTQMYFAIFHVISISEILLSEETGYA